MCIIFSYNGDYNIDLLAVNSDNHAQSFYENVTSQGFEQDLHVYIITLIH